MVVPDSISGREQTIQAEIFCRFPQSLQPNARIVKYFKIGHNDSLSELFIVIILLFNPTNSALVAVKICRGADKSLAFLISNFSICSTTKRIFLGWVKKS
jgi:hypothetical protein